ncbi:MAG: enoyl-CoA hydratase [Rhodospirillaceae bacterium]|jgi:enoyl-CoA hydratase/carnithine racemase|nr:enoyl-CoA hydratase [Rhodospirillaceae bacterium]MBT4044944.1 enoyl-CoA hydratase [Rhodospirillaceae bacterium]MBT4689417.1 enoyl-CoA hydratase [Rhodospirillaceae bacterium]MBT5079137.1 enoyl-CoA hydratase [Rhodospirillaceae bacterium]MBT5527497.1 enoyl-CoA hydratase [Rhodospirillaceae bacterium]
MITLKREDDVFVLTMGAGENRWNTNFVRAFDARLDEILASEGPAALVTASSNPKFFSNGLDIDWRRGEGDGEGGDKSVFAKEFMAMMGKLITFPVPTVCAINGHGFGAGFMAALCHDVRMMRADRGFLCANEIQLGMSIPDPELALFRHKMSASAFFDTVQLAHRWTGPAAQTAGFVHAVASEDDLLPKAIERAAQLAPLGANRALYSESKERIFGESPSINEENGAAYLLRNMESH